MSLSVREISTLEELTAWNTYIARHPHGTFTQLSRWAELKQQFGWQPHFLVVEDGKEIVGGAIMMDRAGGMGQKISYVPFGPVWNEGRSDVLEALLQTLKAESCASVALRLEPHARWQDGEIARYQKIFKKHGFHHRAKMLQPAATLMLNLEKTEEELMANMRQTTRRYIRQAERAGLTVEVDTTGESLEDFYRMLTAVDERKKFGVHTLEYYQKAWSALSVDIEMVGWQDGEHNQHSSNLAIRQSLSQPYLLFVKKGDVVLGSYFLTRLGNKSWELYGGVMDEGMRNKANYLLKWRAIQTMKQAGVVDYDQWGVAPLQKLADGSLDIEKGHPLSGVTYFKEGYGGQRVEYIGSWDYIHKPLFYKVAHVLKKI